MAKASPRVNRTICVPFCKDTYAKDVENDKKFRHNINKIRAIHPELFVSSIHNGYRMKNRYFSKKLRIWIRRIKIGSNSYTIRPSFGMPYLTAFTDDVKKALFLRKLDVPSWALAHIFSKNSVYWYRMESHLGKFRVVGTTINEPLNIPLHLSADEKHTRKLGEKCYIPTTVGNGCILGVAVSENAGNEALKKSYSVFTEEARRLHPDYSPKTVNTEGWAATKNAWRNLFPTVCILTCFHHIYIKMRNRAKKKYRDIFLKTASVLWHCFEAATQRSFSQRVRRLAEQGLKDVLPDVILNPLKKLQTNISNYSVSYKYPGCHRTSNMIDRLMRRMNQHLYHTKYFHGALEAAECNIRGWALIQNFSPQNPATVKKHDGKKSPAEQLNGGCYHECWLQNLLISASLGGYRRPPLNP